MVALGLLYCKSDNRVKVDIFYEVFANEENRIENNHKIHMFMYILFMLASFCSLKAIIELSKNYDGMSQLSDDQQLTMLGHFEVEDSIRLSETFLKNFFQNQASISYTEYRDKIESGGFDWIFSGTGIRHHLENKNEENREEK